MASATKLCRPLKTYVAPDVDHGTACTCHWTSVDILNFLARCVGSTELIGWLCQLQLE
jgi:hypothetical protein